MQYMGSKNRIAKHILPIMLKKANEKSITTWIEPFVGGGNVIDKVPDTFKRIGIDCNAHVICAMIDIRDSYDRLPNKLTEEDYKKLKGSEPEHIKSWLRFVASFGYKFDNGYSRCKGSNETTYIGYGKRNALKQSPKIQDVDFLCLDYKDFEYPKNSLIYCDPPYEGTTGYKIKFNHQEFWEWCRKMTKEGHTVFISEYKAPDDFECIWKGELKTNFASQREKATHKAIEKLFVYKI